MNSFRKILFPFSIIYRTVMVIRNYLFDKNIFKSTRFRIPVIVVGNLSVGGTGKTPQIEYLIRMLSDTYQVATLSRGYKRQTKGYVLADSSTQMEDVGDEPFQFFSKFPTIDVAVDANRVEGIEQLLHIEPQPEVVLLDDAYQHRKVTADCYILLTAYNDLFSEDWVLPAGNLREGRSGAQRASIVIVTKCPESITILKREKIINAIKNYTDSPVFFTKVTYDNKLYSKQGCISLDELKNEDCYVLAGIANPKPFFDFMKGKCRKVEDCTYPDHYNFDEKDLKEILLKAMGRKIVTTEKDYMRLKPALPGDQLYYLPIQSVFIEGEQKFQEKISRCIESKRATH